MKGATLTVDGKVVATLASHYELAKVSDADGMAVLRRLFPTGQADSLNFCLFSTSGIHGHYGTIEDAERDLANGSDADVEPASVTFVCVQPRLVCVHYGNCLPETAEDIAFLKGLRASSWAVVPSIGAGSGRTADAGPGGGS